MEKNCIFLWLDVLVKCIVRVLINFILVGVIDIFWGRFVDIVVCIDGK